MIALFAALEREAQPVIRRLLQPETGAAAGFEWTRGHLAGEDALVCQTGMGQRAGTAAREVLHRERPALAVSFGVCGGLAPKLHAGDVVICRRTNDEATSTAFDSDPRLVAAAEAAARDAGIAVSVGDAVTVGDFSAGPKRKARLRAHGDIAEMEGQWIAQAAHASGVPFIAVRALSDDSNTQLPMIPRIITPEGRMRGTRVVPYLARRPWMLPLLIRLARDERLALRNLAGVIEAIVPALAAADQRDRNGVG